jgi:hypothetical protein
VIGDPSRNSGSSPSIKPIYLFSDPSRYLLTGIVQPLASHAAVEPPETISTKKQAQDEIEALKTELDKQKRRMVSPPETSGNNSELA